MGKLTYYFFFSVWFVGFTFFTDNRISAAKFNRKENNYTLPRTNKEVFFFISVLPLSHVPTPHPLPLPPHHPTPQRCSENNLTFSIESIFSPPPLKQH